LQRSWSSSRRKRVALERVSRDGASPGRGGLGRPPAHERGSRPPSRSSRLLEVFAGPRFAGARQSTRIRDHALPIRGLLIALGLSLFPAAAAPGLDAKPSRSTDGVYQLSWQATGQVLLEEARDPGFTDSRIVYRGRDQATTLTGRSDGVYYYRLSPAAPADASSEAGSEEGRPAAKAERSAVPVQVRVEHHSLFRALSVFLVGLAVFAATVRLVLAGPDETVPGEGAGEGPKGNAHAA